MDPGWVKIHRKMLNNPRSGNPKWLAVWIYLLLNATHSEKKTVFGKHVITLKPGQLVTGRKKISANTGLNENSVERLLKMMKTEQQIEQQGSNVNRLITIINWNEYQGTEQGTEQRANNDRTTTEQRPNTYKNVKKEENERMEELPPKSPKGDRRSGFKGWSVDDFRGQVLEANADGLLLPEEIENFIGYWCEPNGSGRPRFALEKTWDTRRRMQTALRLIFEKDRQKNNGGGQKFEHAVGDGSERRKKMRWEGT